MEELKIREDIDLEELKNFVYEKNGGTEPYWHFYYWIKEIHGIFNDYQIVINGTNRKIYMFENLSPSKSFANKRKVNKKRLIHDIIKAKLVRMEK